MSKYEYDIRRPMKRKDAESSMWGIAIVCILVVVIFAGIAITLAKQTNDAAVKTAQTHDSMTYVRTNDGGTIRVYVVTDPDSQVQYVVSDRGGICPRYDRYGRIMGVSADG